MASTQPTAELQRSNHVIDPVHRHVKVLGVLGLVEIVIGCLSLLLGVSVVSLTPNACNVYNLDCNDVMVKSCQGIWCAAFIIVTGILAVRVKNTPQRFWYVANISMAVITASATCAGTVLSGLASSTYPALEQIVIHAIITALLFCAFVTAIIHTSFSCIGVCCSAPPTMSQQFIAMMQQGDVQARYTRDASGQHTTTLSLPDDAPSAEEKKTSSKKSQKSSKGKGFDNPLTFMDGSL